MPITSITIKNKLPHRMQWSIRVNLVARVLVVIAVTVRKKIIKEVVTKTKKMIKV